MPKQKSKKPKSRKPKAKTTPGSTTLKNPKWELFAHLYAGHYTREIFGNGTQCYSLAYGYRDKINDNLKKIEELQHKKPAGYTVKVDALKSNNRSMENISNVEAIRLLRKPMILERVNYLMDQLITNEYMDRELTFVAMQRGDLHAKVSAIREYNKVKDRTSEKLEGDFTFRWADEEPEK